MVPMVFGHFSLLFKLMLERGTNYARGLHSIRQTRDAFGHCADNAQELLHMLSTQGGNS